MEAAGMRQEAEETQGLVSDPKMGSHTWEGHAAQSGCPRPFSWLL